MSLEPIRSWMGLVLLWKSSLAPSTMGGSREKLTMHNPEGSFTRTPSCWHPDFGLPSSRTVRNKSLWFMNGPVMIFCYSSQSRLRQDCCTLWVRVFFLYMDVQSPTGMKLQLDQGLSDPGRAVLLTWWFLEEYFETTCGAVVSCPSWSCAGWFPHPVCLVSST